MKKNSLIKKILKIILPLILPFLGIVAIATGLLAVVTLVMGFLNSLFGTNNKEVDISNYTTAQLIAVVDDDNAITEEMLDAMMIDRESLKNLLKGVEKANTEFATRDIKVQQKHEYVEISKEVVKDKDGNSILDSEGKETYISSSAKKVDYNSYKTITVSNESIESSYRLYWQQLYVFAIMRTLNYYGENRTSEEVETDGVSSEELQQAADDAKKESEKNADKNKTEDEKVEISKEEGTIVTSGVLSQFDGQYNPSTDWDDAFDDAARSTNLPVGLIKAIAWTESSFNERAKSNANPPACGIMQLTPNGAGNGLTEEELFTAEISIKRGASFFGTCLERFEGDVVLALCAYNRGANGLQRLIDNGELKGKHLNYSAKVLNTYFGNIGLTGDKLLSGNYTLYMNGHGGIGVYDPDTGRLQLSSLDINKLIDDYRAKFIYNNDVVGDEQDTYSYDESKGLSSGALNHDGGNSNTEEGKYSWYVPRSSITNIMLPYEDIYFSDEGTTYAINNSRWYALLETYWSSEYYAHDWYEDLVTALPRGQEAMDDMNYYVGLASDQFQVAGSIANVVGGGSLGYYRPSTSNPYAAADEYLEQGVTRKWSMTKHDLQIINMTDAEIWKVLTGKEFSRKPKPGEVTESEMYARTTTITIPVWQWSGKTGLKKKASKVTIRVNNALAYMFVDIFKDIYEDDSKPVIRTIGYYYFRPVKLPDGSYSKTSLSVHSFGAAIDINANSTVKTGTKEYTNWIKQSVQHVEPTYSEWVNLKDTRAKYELLYIDCPIVQVFKAYGFKWGEDFSDKKDGMHFSKVGDGTQSEGQQNHLKYFK